jgi:catechol 2,3-dioxygenase-like lactoylglutathione lyase family enzyme
MIGFSIDRLHHVQVTMPECGEGEARRFYGELLGMAEVPKPEGLAARGGAWFRSGSAELHVGVERPFQAAEKAHPAFVVNGLDVLCDRLQEHGVAATPDDLLPGFRRAYVKDPFGNRIELLEPAATTSASP